jgi:hypothetical protein
MVQENHSVAEIQLYTLLISILFCTFLYLLDSDPTDVVDGGSFITVLIILGISQLTSFIGTKVYLKSAVKKPSALMYSFYSNIIGWPIAFFIIFVLTLIFNE